ncbi:TCR/Tet family MFS transporter [Mycetohabitans endofungorum]|uniref:TCR/Tet family MFS transporter n=1 Tax=Mycetohabitans endofungorum TaxID=417203 RepID=UPI0030CB591B
MSPALGILLLIITLGAIGSGIIQPVVPSLLREFSATQSIASQYGMLLAVYALAQCLCSPVLGALSDRLGRRPVLLVSLIGASIDYAVMAIAPTLGVLVLARLVAGMTSANLVVATAAIADIAPDGQRAKYYGYLHACFGLGLVIGPVLGGLLSQASLRYPFMLAALLNALTCVLAWRALPESHHPHRRALAWKDIHPFAALQSSFRQAGLLPLLAVFSLIELAAQIPYSLWAIYGENRFSWNPRMIGVSLAVFGLLHALTQSLVVKPTVARLGERRAILLSLGMEALGYAIIAFATRGWVTFAVMPMLVAGAIALPTLQALLSRRVAQHKQGELQGALVSVMSLAGVIGPLMATTLYALSYDSWTGWTWLVGALLSLIGMLRLNRLLRNQTAT